MLDRVPPGHSSTAGLVPVSFTTAKPLRFIKQAVTMIFSANSPGFAEKNPDLVRFVLNKQARGLPPQYDVYMALLRGKHSRMSGVGGMLRFDKCDRIVLSEVAHPPFGIVMTFDSPPIRDYGCISCFAEFDYDENRDVTVLMSTGEICSPYPDDNRGRSSFDCAIPMNATSASADPDGRPKARPLTPGRATAALAKLDGRHRDASPLLAAD